MQGAVHRSDDGILTHDEVDVNIKPGKSVAKIQKVLFKVCREIVKTRYTQTDPDNIRHADLTALFMFNFWNAMGLTAHDPVCRKFKRVSALGVGRKREESISQC